jgi:DNA-binding transcriptional LysR family regulator
VLDLHRLRLLREIVVRGSVTAAAEALAYTPSALSQQMATLRTEVGTPLFEREGRTLRPTATARLLASHTDRILDSVAEAEAALASSLAEVGGDVHIGAFATGVYRLAAPAALELQRDHPAIRVHVHEMEDQDSLRELRLGTLDVILLQEYSHFPSAAPLELHRETLMTEPVLLARPRRWKAPDTLADLADAPWISEPAVNPLGTALRYACRAAGFEPNIRHSANSIHVVVALVGRGLGVGIVPRLALRGQAEDVVFAPVPGHSLTRSITAATRPALRGRPAVAAAIAALHRIGEQYTPEPSLVDV